MDTRDNTLRVVESRWREVSTSPIVSSGSRQPLLSSSSRALVVTRNRQRIGRHLLLTTLFIVILSAGLAILLLMWIIVIRGVPSRNGESVIQSAIRTGEFLVNEGSETDKDGNSKAKLLVLTFSSITTQIVSATIPILLMMTAYCTAGMWLTAQQKGPGASHEEKSLPTPAQFGLLVKLSSSPGLVSIFQTIFYFRRGHRGQRESTPALFISAFFAVVVIYGISHLISLADLWLHVSSSALVKNSTIPVDVSHLHARADNSLDFSNFNPFPLGIKFNDSLCDPPVNCTDDDSNYGVWSTYPAVVASGYLITSNSSFVNFFSDDLPNPRHSLSVITLHDEEDMAIITPGARANHSSTWTGETYGIQATCGSITPQCGDFLDGYNCSAAGFPDFPLDDLFTPPLVNAISNVDVIDFDNPYIFPLGFGWDSVLGTNAPNSTFVGNDTENLVSFAVCTLNCYNLTVQHDAGGIFTIVPGTLVSSNADFARIMLAPLSLNMPFSSLQMRVQTHVMAGENDESILAALNQELARLSIAMFAGSTIAQPPLSLTVSFSSIISRYEVWPVITYTSFIFLYSLVVLFVFAWASTMESAVVRAGEKEETTALRLTQRLLTDSLALVGLALPQTLNGVQEGSIIKRPLDMFGEVGETRGDTSRDSEKAYPRRRAPRLRLDVVEEGPKAGMIFGLRESEPSK